MAKKETMDKLETAVDVVEDVTEKVQDGIETLERIPKVNLNGTTKNQQKVILVTVAVAGVASVLAVRFVVKRAKKLREQSVVAV